MIAAATENYDNSENDDPCAVIVKKMAKAVVIHSMFLRCVFAIVHRSFSYYEKTVDIDTDRRTEKEKRGYFGFRCYLSRISSFIL